MTDEETENVGNCDCGSCDECNVAYITGYYPKDIERMAERLMKYEEKYGKWF